MVKKNALIISLISILSIFGAHNSVKGVSKLTGLPKEVLEHTIQYLTLHELGNWVLICRVLHDSIYTKDSEDKPSPTHIKNKLIYPIITPESSVRANNVYFVTWFLKADSNLAKNLLTLSVKHLSLSVLDYLLSTIKSEEFDFSQIILAVIQVKDRRGLRYLLGSDEFMKKVTEEGAIKVLKRGMSSKSPTLLKYLLNRKRLMQPITASSANKLLEISILKNNDIKGLVSSKNFIQCYGAPNANKLFLWAATEGDQHLVKTLIESTPFMSHITQDCFDQVLKKPKNYQVHELLKSCLS